MLLNTLKSVLRSFLSKLVPVSVNDVGSFCAKSNQSPGCVHDQLKNVVCAGGDEVLCGFDKACRPIKRAVKTLCENALSFLQVGSKLPFSFHVVAAQLVPLSVLVCLAYGYWLTKSVKCKTSKVFCCAC